MGYLFLNKLQTLECRIVLEPLIRHVSYYDDLRIKMETRGGNISDLEKISDALKKPISIGYDPLESCLADVESLQRVIFFLCGLEVILDVRQLETDMPVYYLCRVRKDFWSEYSLVVEDLYRSPGYPVLDDRFVKFMTGGHETYHLRLSSFRKFVLKMLMKKDRASEERADEVLYNLGRYVYHAAWHEDQLPAILCANHFGLPKLKQAIELLYVCLTAELCELRSVTDEDLLGFFECLDPRDPIGKLLRLLAVIEGSAITDIPEKALKFYCKLNQAFSRFLKIEVLWGDSQNPSPLYKLVFANFSRLDLVASTLKKNDALEKAIRKLETEAEAIMEEILTERRL